VSETNSGDDDVVAEPSGNDAGVEPVGSSAEDGATGSNRAEPAASKAVAGKAKAPAPSRSAGSGRVTPKGGATAKQPVASGRYTPPIPRQVRHSPQWFPFVLLGFLILGLLLIVLNYVNVLPGGTSNWYLIGGIGAIVVGLFMATFYH
jgi:hypothetical protein